MTGFSDAAINARRQQAARVFNDRASLVIIGAGQPISIPGGQDRTYRFVPHPEYYWLTGSRRWGGALVYGPGEGWTHFVRPVTEEERLWEGDPEAPEGEDIAQLPRWLAGSSGDNVAILGVSVPGVAGDAALSAALREQLDTVRRRKDAAELELVERAVQATAAGHTRARQVIRPGVNERQIQIELEAEMYRHGADYVGYGTIVGSGAHAAVLHFEPGEKTVGVDEVVLVDAGGEVGGYTADVTRTYAAGERFTAEQQAIYDTVLTALLAATAHCRPGVEWYAVHYRAATVLAQGLRELGILRGEIDGLLETGAIALFFPHGIGHMVGLGVRDVGGRAPGRSVDLRYCGVRLRVDMPLEENLLMTVEPGIYFVPALLDDPAQRERYREMVDWERLERWRPVGGVRIEDNVLVTAGEPRVLTAAIPK